jgi:hypothetical protein
MQDIKEIHKQLEEKRKELRELNKMMRDELAASKEYCDKVEEAKTIRDKKKSIENEIQGRNSEALGKIDLLKLEIKTFAETLSDVAINKYAARESVEFMDDHNNRWSPVFSVKFKKEEAGEDAKLAADVALEASPRLSEVSPRPLVALTDVAAEI